MNEVEAMKTYVVKIGGQAVQDLDDSFFNQLVVWQEAGIKVIIVHGGGPQIGAISQQLGIAAPKIDGIRVTNKQEIRVVQAVLLGVVQPSLINKLKQHQIQANSLNLNSQVDLKGTEIDTDRYGLVGKLVSCRLPEVAFNQDIRVVAPLVETNSGQLLNVNADSFAAGLAKQIKADKLLFLTDVPGVLHEHEVIDELSELKAKQLFNDGEITSGMIPKINAAVTALKSGVDSVAITGSLTAPGTEISLANEEVI